MSGQFDPYHKWLAIPPEEQPPNHYRLLAVTVFESDPDVIDAAADQRMSHLRTYQTGKNAELSQKLLNEISSARICLLNPDQRAAYDEQLRASLVETELTPLEDTAAPLSAEVQLTNAFETPRVATAPAGAVGPAVVQQRRPSKRPRRWMLPALLSGGSLVVLVVIIAIVSSNGDPQQQTAQGDTSSKDTPPPPSDGASKDKQAPYPDPDAAPTSRDDTKLPSDLPDMPPTNDSGKPTDPPDSIEPMIPVQPKDSQPKDVKLPEEPLAEGTITNSIGMKLAYIPAGEFLMGSPEIEERQGADEHQHRVRITKPFLLGVYEVTQQQFEKVMGTCPWQGKDRVREGPGNPAVYVNWNDAVEFCRKLGAKEGVQYHLPTEAQWEYACRAGTSTNYSFGNDQSKVAQHVRCSRNSYHIGENYAHPVGQKLPNPWGLYDMHGNISEWCQDWYATYSSEDIASDPIGPAQGKRRVLRGGSWNNEAPEVRSASRHSLAPVRRNDVYGFRVACVSDKLPVADIRNPDDTSTDPGRPDTPKRSTVPTDEQQKPVLATLRETYALSEHRTIDQKLELARELFNVASDTSDSIEKFVLLRGTTSFAAQGGDVGLMLKAVDEIDRYFEIDRLEIGQKALLGFAKAASSDNAVASLSAATTRFIEEAIAADRVDLASELADSVYSATVTRPFAVKFRKQLNDQRKQVSELYSQWKKIRDAQALLKTNPDDPNANLVIGKLKCFTNNDWETGLLYLAKSNDPLLSSLAKRETTSPPKTTRDQIALADAWWEAAQSASSTDRLGFVTRAARWYRLAQPEVTSGIDKVKIEKRLKEIAERVATLDPGPRVNNPSPKPNTPNNLAKQVMQGKWRINWGRGGVIYADLQFHKNGTFTALEFKVGSPSNTSPHAGIWTTNGESIATIFTQGISKGKREVFTRSNGRIVVRHFLESGKMINEGTVIKQP